MRELGRDPHFRVLGSATAAEEIEPLVKGGVPAVVIFDYEALGPNSEGVIARLHRAEPRARILVLARRSGRETSVSVLRAGASGMVGKEMAFATLVAAILAVAAGQVWANRETTARVIEQLVTSSRVDDDGTPVLTRREWEVVTEIARGLRNRQIALELGISEKTVKTHLNNIFAKLRTSGRLNLALWAQGQAEPKA